MVSLTQNKIDLSATVETKHKRMKKITKRSQQRIDKFCEIWGELTKTDKGEWNGWPGFKEDLELMITENGRKRRI